MDCFETAVALIAGVEGGWARDPHDPGGETKFGISKRAYPALDIASLTIDQAKAIFRRDYWTPHGCAAMPWPWALAVFDGEVNQGGVVALAQDALGVAKDGVAGQATLRAMGLAPPDRFRAFLALRAMRYAAANDFARFGRGWLARLIHIAQAAEHPPG